MISPSHNTPADGVLEPGQQPILIVFPLFWAAVAAQILAFKYPEKLTRVSDIAIAVAALFCIAIAWNLTRKLLVAGGISEPISVAIASVSVPVVVVMLGSVFLRVPVLLLAVVVQARDVLDRRKVRASDGEPPRSGWQQALTFSHDQIFWTLLWTGAAGGLFIASDPSDGAMSLTTGLAILICLIVAWASIRRFMIEQGTHPLASTTVAILMTLVAFVCSVVVAFFVGLAYFVWDFVSN